MRLQRRILGATIRLMAQILPWHKSQEGITRLSHFTPSSSFSCKDILNSFQMQKTLSSGSSSTESFVSPRRIQHFLICFTTARNGMPSVSWLLEHPFLEETDISCPVAEGTQEMGEAGTGSDSILSGRTHVSFRIF